MINILILEDEEIQRKNLKKMIEEIGGNFTIYEAQNINEAFEITDKIYINLFYIDVNLAKSSGLDFAYEIRKIQKYKFTWIVFITAEITHMLSAFKEIHCYDYIIKPYSKEKVQQLTLLLMENLNSSSRIIEQKREAIIFDIKGVEVKIFIDEIIFISVYLRTITIHTENGEYKVNNKPLKKFINTIKNDYFIQSHRSYFINLNYVREINKRDDMWIVHFNNTKEIAFVGKKFKKDIMNKFRNS